MACFYWYYKIMPITIYEKDQYEPIKKAGILAGTARDLACTLAKPGISTWEIDKQVEEWIREHGATPTFKGYMGFPASVCTSINHEVVHGIPSKSRILKEGDIVSFDVGVTVTEKNNGKEWKYIGDTARTVPIGEISSLASQLILDTNESLFKGTEMCMAGKTIKDISIAVNNIAKEKKYGIVRMFGGHGIGPEYHAEPFIPNWPEYFQHNENIEIKVGMLLCIEPMFNLGADDVRKLKDNWTVVTSDHKLSAHFEHTILITEEGPHITTKTKEN